MFEPERRDLAWVPRWSIIRTIRTQNVAEHSYYVCCYGLKIASQINWPFSYTHRAPVDHYRDLHRLTVYLLRHDEGECLTGDVPGPTKRACGMDETRISGLLRDRFGDPANATHDMTKIKRVADLVDECLFLAGEMQMGNSSVRSTMLNSRRRLLAAIEQLPASPDDLRDLTSLLIKTIDDEERGTKDLRGLENV